MMDKTDRIRQIENRLRQSEKAGTDKRPARRFVFALLIGAIIGVTLLLTAVAIAERPQPTDQEPAWSSYLAEQMGGIDGNRPGNALPDGTRYDILTKTTAYEVEWSDKKGESVFQSLHYMLVSGKPQAGIIILERGDAEKDLKQLMDVVQYLQTKGVPIHVETIEVSRKQ